MRTDDKTLLELLRALAPVEDLATVRAELEGLRAEDLAEAFVRL